MKAFYRSQKDMPGKTKADVLKEIWEEIGKVTDKPVPPLDEEMLAELAEEPAVIEGEFKHTWGNAEKLYKSEAIDAFGAKYLLGVFETKDEAMKAFADWNGEYETPAPYKPAPYKEPEYDAPAVYKYGYAVADDYSGANFEANEGRDGYATSGSYRVALPDGRTQIVTYTVAD